MYTKKLWVPIGERTLCKLYAKSRDEKKNRRSEKKRNFYSLIEFGRAANRCHKLRKAILVNELAVKVFMSCIVFSVLAMASARPALVWSSNTCVSIYSAIIQWQIRNTVDMSVDPRLWLSHSKRIVERWSEAMGLNGIQQRFRVLTSVTASISLNLNANGYPHRHHSIVG